MCPSADRDKVKQSTGEKTGVGCLLRGQQQAAAQLVQKKGGFSVYCVRNVVDVDGGVLCASPGHGVPHSAM